MDPNLLSYDFDERQGFGVTVAVSRPTSPGTKVARGILIVGLLGIFIAAFGRSELGLPAFALTAMAAVGLALARYHGTPPGIRNDGTYFDPWQRRGPTTVAIALGLTIFYVALYFRDELIARTGIDPFAGLVRSLDALSQFLRGVGADHWFLYGFLYTGTVLVFGIRMLLRYRHQRYQQIRTLSVSFFQLGFAFLIPGLLKRTHAGEFYLTYFWPLKPEYLLPSSVQRLLDSGGLGHFFLFWTVGATILATPILTYFFGKRWYCSWVCGCGGLAETLGDPWRQHSDKSARAWKIERVLIYGVLASILATTALVWMSVDASGQLPAHSFAHGLNRFYGLYVGALFAGVVGVGFYPLLGSRVWCRFGCPMAAILGLLQRTWSRFRITTNGGQCISCGNCSTYCEMGIDVRAYAQRGENIVRSSCVGCGICSAVCPRGVLNLENGKTPADRFPGAESPASVILDGLRNADPHRTRA